MSSRSGALVLAATLATLTREAASDTCSAPAALGCFVDPYASPSGPQTRVLSHTVSTTETNLTHASCIAACCAAGFGAGDLAGIRNGTECACDHQLGPYNIPQDSEGCHAPCSGDTSETCGGVDRMQVLGITTCSPGSGVAGPWRPPAWVGAASGGEGNIINNNPSAKGRGPATLRQCGQGCTVCPAQDTCCIGRSPDAYRVPGGYGCAPPNSSGTPGCASGGVFPGGCCCGPGPAVVSATLPNVLVVGDSVSAGYTPFLQTNLSAVANVQHGPDNSGGGNADGVGYGALCIDYFLRTPTHQLPAYAVVAFNFGLHDGADSNETYTAGLSHIADVVVNATTQGRAPGKAGRAVYFQTTIPGGGGSVPGSISPDDKRVLELNALAADIMAARNITVVDLYETMTQCGDTCKDCRPHCPPAGYEFLVNHAIAPAIRDALQQQEQKPLQGQ